MKHSDMVYRLVKSGAAIQATLTAHKVDFWHGATGVVTEAGELLDAAKKYCIYNKPIDKVNVIEELGDIEFYLEQVRQSLDITRDQTLEANIAKLKVRYDGLVYSDTAAQARADKVGDLHEPS